MLALVGFERVGKVEKFDTIFIEPEIVEDVECRLFNPIEAVPWRVSVVNEVREERLACILKLVAKLSVLSRPVVRVYLEDLHASPVL